MQMNTTIKRNKGAINTHALSTAVQQMPEAL